MKINTFLFIKIIFVYLKIKENMFIFNQNYIRIENNIYFHPSFFI